MSRPRRVAWLAGLLLIVTIGSPGTASRAEPRCGGAFAPGIVLVHPHHAYPLPRLTLQAAITTIPEIGVVALRVPTGQECAVMEMYRRDPRVSFAELDYAIHATAVFTPNDPGWTSQWGPARIGAPAAWEITPGTTDALIAVLDSGIRLDHEDLGSQLWTNPGEIPDNGVDDDGNGKVDDFWGWRFTHEWDGQAFVPREDNQVADDHGHGTHVAGIAGAAVNNGLGIAGMAGHSRLMAVKVLDSGGDGWYSDLVQGIVYAVDNGARVINLSLGSSTPSQTAQEAVNYAHAHGVLVVASAGNTGGDVLYPAAYEHVLAVAATDQDENVWVKSNHGPQLDVAAPGVNVYSTGWIDDPITDCSSGYCTKSGTSMATPHVSGLAALIWSARPTLAIDQVTGIITGTASDVNAATSPGHDVHVGWGRVEAGRALSTAVHAGNLYLTASPPRLPVGESATITATVPMVSGTASLLTFATSGGTVSPTKTALGNGLVTTTLTAGPSTGTAIVTATTGTQSGSVFLRLLPGPVVTATLTPTAWELAPGQSTGVSLTARDRFGNPPLDSTPIQWRADGGTVTPARSTFHGGIGRALFIADLAPGEGTATITARLDTGFAVAVAIDVHLHLCYLPITWRGDGFQAHPSHGQ